MERESERPPYLPRLQNPWSDLVDYIPERLPTLSVEPATALPLPGAPPGASEIPQEGAAALLTTPAGENQQPQQERQRVTLSGRVGAAPAFRKTPKGQTVATFPLGVHPDPDTTVWHTILIFAERADKLRGQIRKGEPVEVIGYLHTREVRGRDGNSKTVEEIYAVAVRK